MSKPKEFSRLVEVAISEGELDRLKNIEPRPSRNAMFIGAALALRQERNRDIPGTHPEELWGGDGAKLCKDFLKFMAQNGFPGSMLLRHKLPLDLDPHPHVSRKEARHHHKIEKAYAEDQGQPVIGYRIGSLTEKTAQKKSITTYIGAGAISGWSQIRTSISVDKIQPNPVYLCQDGMVRMQKKVSAPGFVELAAIPVNTDDDRVDVPAYGEPMLPYLGIVPKDKPSLTGATILMESSLRNVLVHIAAVSTSA